MIRTLLKNKSCVSTKRVSRLDSFKKLENSNKNLLWNE